MKNNTPTRLYTAEQVRAIDQHIIREQGVAAIVLMRRAAAACCEILSHRWPKANQVRVYCGSGNNAADGFIVAGMLAEKGMRVDVVQIGDTAKLGVDGQMAFEYCQQSSAQLHKSDANLELADVVVDALLGTGMTGAPRPEYAAAIERINQLKLPILSVDVPSGLNADTGMADASICADVTVTFIAHKRGLWTANGVDLCGELVFAELETSTLDARTLDTSAYVNYLSFPELMKAFPKRPRNAHKNTFGHVLVVGGDLGMGGAPLMTATAALRSGAGLVSVATRPEHAPQLMAARPELMVRGVTNSKALEPLLSQADVVALGPGLGQSDWAMDLFQAVLDSGCPLVIDADGLNLLAKTTVKNADWILTPHPGEAHRLLGRSVQEDRFAAAQALQQQYGGVTVLKGAGTLIASEDGLSLCPYGNPGMSTAGMGDVLCGVIGGLMAQTGQLKLSAELGVAAHSFAADHCVLEAGERGLLATDLLPTLRRLLNGL